MASVRPLQFPLFASNLSETLAVIAAKAAGSGQNPALNQKVPAA
jgi:hypothetical protein